VGPSGNGERQLQTQVRELRVLLRLTSLINDRELPLELLLKRLVDVLPQAYQYPQLARARVECAGRSVQSVGFHATASEQSVDIGTLINRSGRLTVCYLEPCPEEAEGPFLEAERELLNTVGELLGERLEREGMRGHLKEVFAGTHFLIAYLDRELCYQRVNPAYAMAAGLRPEDFAGRSHRAMFPGSELDAILRRVLATGEGYTAQDVAVSFFGAGTNFDLDLLPVGREGSEAQGLMLILVDRRGRKQALSELKKSKGELARLASHLQDLREEERRRIAREVHDELGGMLTSIKMDLSLLAGPDEEREPILARAGGLVDQTITLIRRIASDLRPQLLDDLGLAAALEWLVSEFGKRTGVRCRFQCLPSELNVPRDTATALFRIVQEGLTNVARHAQAHCVSVLVEAGNGLLEATVRDDGIGITQAQARGPEAFGLMGMQERAARFGGKVDIRGRKGSGTTLRVELPLRA